MKLGLILSRLSLASTTLTTLALLASGCAVQAGDPQPSESSASTTQAVSEGARPEAPKAKPELELPLPCHPCTIAPAPAPSVEVTVTGYGTIAFEAGPFPAGHSIFVGVWNASGLVDSTTVTSEWTCPSGLCFAWSNYASGNLGLACGHETEPTEWVYAIDETAASEGDAPTLVGPATTQGPPCLE